MLCSQCEFENPPQMRFCGQCGHRLQTLCPSCGAEVPPGFKFCGECGGSLAATGPNASPKAAPISAAPVTDNLVAAAMELPSPAARDKAQVPVDPGRSLADEGEMKQVTSLSCELDLETGDKIGPEVLYSLLNHFFDIARVEVQRFGGTINQFFSQGFLAVFGVSVASEDHAPRAVLAAMRIREQIGNHQPDHAADPVLRARMGSDTGRVLVGGGGGMVIGDSTREAERLQRIAPAGNLLVSGRTASLVKGHVEMEVSENAGAGGEPVFLVTSELARASDPVSLFRDDRLSPFVGRNRELQQLRELCAQAEGGEGQLVGISGEAGAGKSRFLYEFGKSLRGQTLSVLQGRCLSYGNNIPYLPFVDMIRKASRIAASDSVPVVSEKLRASLESVGTAVEESLPFFLRLLGVDEGTQALQTLGPLALKAQTFAAMRRMVLDASRRSLVVIEIEDIHWIDATSEEFLASLIEQMGGARLLLLLTHRSEYRPRWLDRSYASQIALRRLSAEASQRLLRSLLERNESTLDLGGEILDKAQGNPFFLEELGRSLLEHQETTSEAPVPNTIQGILMARIDRLPAEHKSLLRTAAVLGREVSFELLTAIWDRSEPVEPLIEDLQRWELLYRTPHEDQALYFFKHNLIQEVIYQSLLTARRVELHKRTATALEKRQTDQPHELYGDLAFHYARAEDPEKSVFYLSLLADRAAASYAHAEAAEALEEALEHADHLEPESGDRRMIEIVLQLAESLLPLARFPATLELCQKHRERVDRLDDPALVARFYFWLAHTYTYLGQQEHTRDSARRSIAAAKECGDEAIEGKACYVLGRDGFWSGRFKDGIANSLRAVVLLERTGESWWQGQAHWVAGFNHYALGQLAQGIEALERAYRIGEALDDYRLDTSWSLGYVHASLGQWEQGIEKCRRGLKSSRDPLNTAVATGFLGYTFLRKGDPQLAISTLRDALAQLHDTGMQQILGWFTVFLGEAYLAAGQYKEAREAVAQALDITHRAEFWFGKGLAQRALGRVALGESRWGEAENSLGDAAETFTSLEVPLELAHLHADRARLAWGTGDISSATTELTAAYRQYSDLGAAFFVYQTEALARELGVPLEAAG